MLFIKGKIYRSSNWCLHDNPSTCRREHWCNGVLHHSFTLEAISETANATKTIKYWVVRNLNYTSEGANSICFDPWVDNQIKGYSKAKTYPAKSGNGWDYNDETELHHEFISEYNEQEYNLRAKYL
jgi:hypothetical protein